MSSDVVPPQTAQKAAPHTERARVALIQGFVGSMMMFVGSLGVGWLARASYELSRQPFMIWLRLEVVGVILSIVLLSVGTMLLVRSWLRLGQRLKGWGEGSLKVVYQALALWSAPLIIALPLFSRDVFAYIVQGLVMQNGLNPYEDGYANINNYLQYGADDLWSSSPTPYGPLFLMMEWAVVGLTGGQVELSILLFRLLAVIGVIGCAYFVPKLAAIHGINPARATWISVLNPLFLANFVAAIHNDSLMLAFALAGLYAMAKKKPVLAIVLVTLSIAIKPITILFLPFLGLMWAGKNASLLRRIVFMGIVGVSSLLMLWLMGLSINVGLGWIGALSTPGSVWIWYAPVGFLGWQASTVANSLGLDGGFVMNTLVFGGFKIVALGVIFWTIFWGSYEKVIRRLAIAFAALVFLSPMVQTWYMMWVLVLFAITGIRDDWQSKLIYVLTAAFAVYSVSDQLDIIPYLPLDLTLARNLAACIAIAFTIYLIVADPRTRGLFLKRRVSGSGAVTT